MEIMRKQVSAMLGSMNTGANVGAGGQHSCNFQAGVPEANPNPAERKSMRPGLLLFGVNEDVNMENGLTPVIIPLLPGGKDPFAMLEVPVTQQVVADGGG